MIDREKALAVVRSDEQAALASLGGPGTARAFTDVPLSRAMYAAIEDPPTRHQTFVIRTIWIRAGWVADSHSVLVKDGHRYRQVVAPRPGAFGAEPSVAA